MAPDDVYHITEKGGTRVLDLILYSKLHLRKVIVSVLNIIQPQMSGE